jgi:uncharacterized membrane protein
VHAPAFADYAQLACSLIRRYEAAEPTVSAALLIMLHDAQALITDPDRMQVLAGEARLVLSDAEQLTRQHRPADPARLHPDHHALQRHEVPGRGRSG